jgi:hypothetical protein
MVRVNEGKGGRQEKVAVPFRSVFVEPTDGVQLSNATFASAVVSSAWRINVRPRIAVITPFPARVPFSSLPGLEPQTDSSL